MSKSYPFMLKTSNFKYMMQESFQKNKLLLLSLIIFAIIGLLTGVFVAFKCGITVSTISDYNLSIYTCSQSGCFSDFCARFFSCVCNLLILSLVCFNFLIPIGYIAIAYRAYLAGFNVALLLCLYGISGAITSLLIVFPFQIIFTIIFIIYFTILINRAVQKKKFGFTKLKFLKIFCTFLIIFAILCLLETLLMSIFNASTIFVI